MSLKLKRSLLLAGLAAALPAVPAAQAQDAWPTEPITIVVPFDAGGSVDRLARGLAEHMSPIIGQPMAVENRPGAGGQSGTSYFLSRPQDCNTLMVSPASPYILTNILVTGADYTLDDFDFVNAQWIDFAMVMTNKDKPYQTLEELIEAIKANPGELSVAVVFGSIGQIATMVLLDALGIPAEDVRLVTYDGGAGSRTAVAGGQVDFAVEQAEGSDTIRDMIRPLALFRTEAHPEWDAPLINDVLKPMGAEVPILSGSVRTLVAPAGCKAEFPERWEKVMASYEEALNTPAFQEWAEGNQIGADWVGHEETEAIISNNLAVLEEYKDLLD